MNNTQVSWAIVLLTILCGIAASWFALMPTFYDMDAFARESVNEWARTLSYIFTGGMGVIFGGLGAPR